MPPRTRTRKAKGIKENADVENNFRNTGKVVKSNRKVLGDKTNSLSDDNETVIKSKQVPTKLSLAIENNGRPLRQKRLPARFKENRVLNTLSTSQNNLSNPTTIKDLASSKIVGNEENVLEITKRQVPETKNTNTTHKIATSSVTNILENHEKNTLKRNCETRHQINKSLTSENIPKNDKVVPSKEGNTTITKRKILERQKKQIMDTKTKTKSKDVKQNGTSVSKNKSPNKSQTSNVLLRSSTFTPPSDKALDSEFEKSLIINRPKRIHRLPSRFDDHSISPNKFIPVQPCHASTPLNKNSSIAKRIHTKPSNTVRIKNKDVSTKTDKKSNNISPDSNNNPKRIRSARLKVKPKTSPTKSSPRNLKTGKWLLDKSLSFKVLNDNKKSKDCAEKLDVYEFTFDPDEEPEPQKKKKKRVVKKNPSKPKTIVVKKNYDKNMSKAIAALKEVVAMYKNAKDQSNKKVTQVQNDQIASTSSKDQNAIQCQQTISNGTPQIENLDQKVTQGKQYINQNEADLDAIKQLVNNGNKSVYENPPSINVEDIEADVERSYHDDINYSPVNSPRPSSPNPVAVTQYSNAEDQHETIESAIYNNDPLNLQDDISFFDDQPVANSSMNMSVKHPLASPWRVEFGRLPIKWPANTYLKANMTPAVESSFISSEDSNKKKHVYVNMIAQASESLPQIVERNTSNLKQTSIISFMREVAERIANKKKRGKSLSPIKASTLFEDVTNKSNADMQKSSKEVTKKAAIAKKTNKDVSNSSSNTSNDKENVRETRKRKNDNAISKLPAKSPRKEKDMDVTYFGFDDSGNDDQENVVPNKNSEHNKGRSLRSRSRVLQEINDKNGPARAALPLAAKTKITSSSEAVKRMYEDLKSAEDAPQLMDKNDQLNAGTSNIDVHQSAEIDNEECDSVHLFEDIDIVHHLKPTRKSYGKAKKVTFRQRSTSDSETQASEGENQIHSSDEDDLADLTFTMPEINPKKTVKKKKTKQLMSKKEEKEADEWAAGFNSMCEDIEEFPLVVE